MAPPPASWIATRPTIDLAEAAAALERWWGIRGATSGPAQRARPQLPRPAGGRRHAGRAQGREHGRGAGPARGPGRGDGPARGRRRPGPAADPVSRDGRDLVDLGDPGPPWARLLTWIDGRPLATVVEPSEPSSTDLGETMGRTASALLDVGPARGPTGPPVGRHARGVGHRRRSSGTCPTRLVASSSSGR